MYSVHTSCDLIVPSMDQGKLLLHSVHTVHGQYSTSFITKCSVYSKAITPSSCKRDEYAMQSTAHWKLKYSQRVLLPHLG